MLALLVRGFVRVALGCVCWFYVFLVCLCVFFVCVVLFLFVLAMVCIAWLTVCVMLLSSSCLFVVSGCFELACLLFCGLLLFASFLFWFCGFVCLCV